MSELSIHELESEHAELLPEREALNGFGGKINGGGNHVDVTQVAVAKSIDSSTNVSPNATATNTAVIAVG
jgi:hypothetical protein